MHCKCDAVTSGNYYANYRRMMMLTQKRVVVRGVGGMQESPTGVRLNIAHKNVSNYIYNFLSSDNLLKSIARTELCLILCCLYFRKNYVD